jgi:hypothetical protein
MARFRVVKQMDTGPVRGPAPGLASMGGTTVVSFVVVDDHFRLADGSSFPVAHFDRWDAAYNHASDLEEAGGPGHDAIRKLYQLPAPTTEEGTSDKSN